MAGFDSTVTPEEARRMVLVFCVLLLPAFLYLVFIVVGVISIFVTWSSRKIKKLFPGEPGDDHELNGRGDRGRRRGGLSEARE